MSVLSNIFGDSPRIQILEVFADHFEEELSIPDLIWLTNLPKMKICNCINRLLEEKILLPGDNSKKLKKIQLYRINTDKQEIQILISLINFIVSEKLSEKLKEKGLKPLVFHR